jgi:FAD synthetase
VATRTRTRTPSADSCGSLPELSLAYNGGKDCLVLLILYLCALHTRGLTKTADPSSHIETAVQCVYIQDTHPFAEVEEFVARSIKTYSLSLLEYAKPMKAAFADYLRDTPSVKAILVGTRRTDPHGEHLKHFDPTDQGWPEFVRIHPVIDWHYVDVWTVCFARWIERKLQTDLHSLFDTSTYLIAHFTIMDTPR